MAPISKKLCGRPNGSKNKPKSTSRSICQPIESSVKLVTINVVSGKGVMETILDVACCDHVSLTVLNAFGMIKNVIICNPPQGAPWPCSPSLASTYTITSTPFTQEPPIPLHFLSRSSFAHLMDRSSMDLLVVASLLVTMSASWSPPSKNPIFTNLFLKAKKGTMMTTTYNYNDNPSDLSRRGDLLLFNMVGSNVRGVRMMWKWQHRCKEMSNKWMQPRCLWMCHFLLFLILFCFILFLVSCNSRS